MTSNVTKMAALAADEDGMGPLERGRRRYQQKDYSGALSAFTEVCVSCMSFSLVIGVFSRPPFAGNSILTLNYNPYKFDEVLTSYRR